MQFVAFFLFFAVVCCNRFADIFDKNLDTEWSQYTEFYGKQYSKFEELYRRAIWEDNVRYVRAHNSQRENGDHTFSLSVNAFADRTQEEFLHLFFGKHRTESETKMAAPTAPTFLPPSNLAALPDHVDWRDAGYVTGVKNELGCPAGWAFAAAGALEGQHFRKSGKLVTLSEQNLIDCGSGTDHGCFHGDTLTAYDYVKKNGGLDTQAAYEYTGKDGKKCAYNPKFSGATLSGFSRIESGNEAALEMAVATVGPVAVVVDASLRSFRLYADGVYNDEKCGRQGNHGVLVVGYGHTFSEGDYYRVKNSWGTQWGEDGYMKMARNRNNRCGIANNATFPLV